MQPRTFKQKQSIVPVQPIAPYRFTNQQEASYKVGIKEMAKEKLAILPDQFIQLFDGFLQQLISSFPHTIVSQSRMKEIAQRELRLLLMANCVSVNLQSFAVVAQRRITVEILNYIQKLVA